MQISEDMSSMTALTSANTRVDRMLSQVAYLAMAFPDLKANQT
jgi:hypothetical protein